MNFKLLFSLVLGALLICYIFKLQSAPKIKQLEVQPINKFSLHTSKSSSSRTTVQSPLRLAEEVVSLLKKRDFSSLELVSKEILEFSMSELIKFAMALDESAKDDQNELRIFLEELMPIVALDSPGKALELGALMLGVEGVSTVERKIMTAWSQETIQEVYSHFLDSKRSIDAHHVSMMASVVQNETIESFDSFLEWLHTVDVAESPHTNKLKADLAFNLAIHSTKETRSRLISFYEQQIDSEASVAGLTIVAGQYLSEDFEEALPWLLNLKAKPETRDTIIQSAILTVSPTTAIRVLEALKPNITSNLASTLEQNPATTSYDGYVETFLETVMWSGEILQELEPMIETISDEKKKKRFHDIYAEIKNEES